MSKKPWLVKVKEKIKLHQSNIKQISSIDVIKANERLDNLSSEIVDFEIWHNPTPPPPPPPSNKDKEIVQVKEGIKYLKTEEVKAIGDDLSNADGASTKLILHKMCPNTKLFMVRIFSYLD